MKILIADDSATIRNLLTSILVQAGFEDLVYARDGLEALASLAAGKIDLALLDWDMPKLSGGEVLKSVRSEGCKTPIIVVTGDSGLAAVRTARSWGVDAYLAKPFKPQLLVERILQVITARQLEDPDWSVRICASIAQHRPTIQEWNF